ncbi:hypothetical protein BVC71_01530 [Marivivens niveibacter]|uniref:Gamma-glutamylcyclotransferase AIG2-like domain-containing protein n=1 Tax=Marivivens niveibacter TaxID=1930667 RepID=A0A251X0Y6_9RHOB|nr:gamma-glutamylcyclotransferase family protein [Marivivens niveibacter]OUD10221.1 hypothetical protein BVC71_01530 [Marivivens niveibacter]
MTHPRFFGYGSLVNLTTHEYPDPQTATLKGWRRVWRHTSIQEPAFLSVEPCDETVLLGVTAQVPHGDWVALDERESGYQRKDVTHLIDGAQMPTAVYEVEARHYQAPSVNPILLSYLDVVVQGYMDMFGDEGAQHFFDTTHNWGPVLNDRADPRYPRARKLTAAQTATVNEYLAKLGQPQD